MVGAYKAKVLEFFIVTFLLVGRGIIIRVIIVPSILESTAPPVFRIENETYRLEPGQLFFGNKTLKQTNNQR
jgi:hypothetical protein